jgi:hypothetical protein
MSEEAFYILQVISTFSALPAIFLGIPLFKSVSVNIKLFLVFFVLGFLIDLFGWYSFLTKNGLANQNMRFVYILIETVFYFWFTGSLIQSKIANLLIKNVWILLLPLWFFATQSADGMRYYMVIFQITISGIISYCMIKSIETEESIWQQLVFWILLGSFFYYFSTFFFMSFLDSQFGLNLWYMRNIIGVISNLIFAWGFFVYRRIGNRV